MNQSFSLLNLFPIIFFVLKSTLLININTIFLLINVGWSIFYYSLRISVYLHLAFFFFFFFKKHIICQIVRTAVGGSEIGLGEGRTEGRW